jgi:hypothetical protein
VDFKTYYEYQSASTPNLGDMVKWGGRQECNCNECKIAYESLSRFSWDGKSGNRELTREQYQMLPPRVLGYALDQKKWVQLHVERLKDLGEASSETFDRKLQLHEDHKMLIKNVVKAHTKSKSEKMNITDYTPGKGKGLVIMLWGMYFASVVSIQC